MCRTVAVGLGLCMLPRSSAQPHVASMGLHVARLEGIETARELVPIMRSRAALSGAAKALVALIAGE
jgi:DNA-binding transcriptional LysR family regulator